MKPGDLVKIVPTWESVSLWSSPNFFYIDVTSNSYVNRSDVVMVVASIPNDDILDDDTVYLFDRDRWTRVLIISRSGLIGWNRSDNFRLVHNE